MCSVGSQCLLALDAEPSESLEETPRPDESLPIHACGMETDRVVIEFDPMVRFSRFRVDFVWK